MKVFVYFNLHKKCWSIKALSGENKGRVIGHAKRVLLGDCEFRVSEAGRQRVLREKRKNVHAGVVGELMGFIPTDMYTPTLESVYDEGDLVTYNPYKYSGFVLKADPRLHVRKASQVCINERGVFAYTKTYYIPEFDTTKEG